MTIFDYHYGLESEQYSFYRIPRILMKDERFKNLSSDAKLLYGLMLDRMSLSQKNSWIDSENRVYIYYAVEEIQDDLGCSRPTAIKILSEIDNKKGIGLIHKIRQGQGKPDIIYVMNFSSIVVREENSEDSSHKAANDSNTKLEPEAKAHERHSEVKNFNFRENCGIDKDKTEELNNADTFYQNELIEDDNSENSEVKNFYFKKLNNFTSRSKESLLQEVKNFNPSYINNNYTNRSISIYQSGDDYDSQNQNIETEKKMDRMDDETQVRELVIEKLKSNINYTALVAAHEESKKLIDGVVSIMCDVVQTDQPVLRISGKDVEIENVRKQFRKLGKQHIEYIIASLQGRNIKSNLYGYMLTTLYSAPKTIGVWDGVRDLNANKDESKQKKSGNRFNNFHQRDYNVDDLESELINNQ